MVPVRIDRFGPPAVLHVAEQARPEPGPEEALVAVHAVGINPVDVKVVAGALRQVQLPLTPGRDFAGVVVAGPEGLRAQEVWGSGVGVGVARDGTHAEYVIVPAAAICAKPSNLSMEQAGAVGTPYVVAQMALVHVAALQAGQTVLMVGSSGAVGRAAAQIAHGRGARVIGANR
jgi:NADPH2:quinone reductase